MLCLNFGGAYFLCSNFDVALDLLKRHSGIVWDPGRFRGIALDVGLDLLIVGGLYSAKSQSMITRPGCGCMWLHVVFGVVVPALGETTIPCGVTRQGTRVPL